MEVVQTRLALAYETALDVKTCTVIRFISLVHCVLTSTSFLPIFLANTVIRGSHVLLLLLQQALSYPRLMENAGVAPDKQCSASVFDPTKGFVPHYREEFIINCVSVSLCIVSLETFWNTDSLQTFAIWYRQLLQFQRLILWFLLTR